MIPIFDWAGPKKISQSITISFFVKQLYCRVLHTFNELGINCPALQLRGVQVLPEEQVPLLPRVQQPLHQDGGGGQVQDQVSDQPLPDELHLPQEDPRHCRVLHLQPAVSRWDFSLLYKVISLIISGRDWRIHGNVGRRVCHGCGNFRYETYLFPKV